MLEPGGRIAVNVANLGRRPYRSLSADVTTILQDDLRLLMRGEVLWVKQRGAAGNCAWGSFQRPGNPVLRDLSERVIIASKGRFDRAISAKERAKMGLPSISTMTRDEFMEATVDVWEIPPERASRVDHPAPFPVALPERLIHMNSYAGDLVLDPFVGSGTTAVAAVRTGRHYIGYDTDAGYIEAARRRLDRRTTRRSTGRSCWPATAGRRIRFAVAGRRRRSPSGSSPRPDSRKIDDDATVVPGVVPTLRGDRQRAAGCGGSKWSAVEPRIVPGAQRIELLWRAISKGAIVREVDPSAGFAVLTVDQPDCCVGRASAGRRDGPRQAGRRGRRHAGRRTRFRCSPRWQRCLVQPTVEHGSRRSAPSVLFCGLETAT